MTIENFTSVRIKRTRKGCPQLEIFEELIMIICQRHKAQRQDARKAQQMGHDYQTADFSRRADHFKQLVKDCEKIATYYDELAASASTDTVEISIPDDLPPTVAGLGHLVDLKKEQSVKDRASLDVERWRQMERISLVAVAERLR